MYSATRLIVLLLCACLSYAAFAQKPPTPKPTATVQGRVLLEDSPQVGIIVRLAEEGGGLATLLTSRPAPTAVTDSEGRYRFSQIAAGKYKVSLHAPAYVSDESEDKPLTIKEGEQIENYDFHLRRGGIIVGKVLDADDQPSIEEPLELERLEAEGKATRVSLNASSSRTDDRGIFRIFGLTPGSYRISAGAAEKFMSTMFKDQPEYQQTYYPNTAEKNEAKPIEVRAGSETTGIEIVLVRAKDKKEDTTKGVTVSGRIFNADTNQPVAGSMVMLLPDGDSKSSVTDPTMPANANGKGEFQFHHVTPGEYTVMLMNVQSMLMGGATTYADPLKVSVAKTDVGGLEIKLRASATLSGRVALDGTVSAAQTLSGDSPLAYLTIIAVPQHDASADQKSNAMESLGAIMGGGMASVKPDQTFTLSGLRPGKYGFRTESLARKKLLLLRIERNGAQVPYIEITGNESLTGIRLVFAAGNATINGRVQVQGGVLPEGTHFSLKAVRAGAEKYEDRLEFTESDKRGGFSFSGLPPGTYEINVMSVRTPSETVFQYDYPVQTITVTDSASQEIVVYVNLAKKENR
jgi:hypothetical protein